MLCDPSSSTNSLLPGRRTSTFPRTGRATAVSWNSGCGVGVAVGVGVTCGFTCATVNSRTVSETLPARSVARTTNR